jgi:hypothetical protein
MKKNIYVTTLYNLPLSGCVSDKNVYDIYKKCCMTSIKNFHKYNKEIIDDYIILVNNENAQNNGEMDYYIIKKLYEIWKQYNANVFYCEIDTLCHGSIKKIFENCDKMTMFSKGSSENPDEFNIGVLYFPYTTKQDTWDTLLKMHSNWDLKWAYFQEIMDKTFKSQFNSYDELKEYTNGLEIYNSFSNNCENPIITHHFSSRGIHKLHELYKNYEDESSEIPSYKEF